MKLFDNLLSKLGYIAKEKAALPGVFGSGSADPFAIWRTTKKIDPVKSLEAYTGFVYAAIRAIAVDVASIDFRLFRVKKDTDEEIYEHEVLDLLGAVNDYQTGLELLYATAAHLEAVGNAYWFLENVKSESSKPLAIHLMIPSKVKVIVNRDDFPSRVTGYEYRLQTYKKVFKPHEVIHFKYPDPNDPYEGIGTVQSIAQWIDADNYAIEFNRRFFLNGARPAGYLTTEAAYTDEQIKYLKEMFREAYTGVQNAYQILALPKGVEFKEGSINQKDLDFGNLMDKMRDRIIAGFRVPKTALGIVEDVNRANAEATDYVFALRTIKPIMKFITTYLNEFLIPRYGDDLYLSFVDPVPEDQEKRMTEMSKATGNNPVISTNEAREKYFGYDPVEGGDAVLKPINQVELGAPTLPKTAKPNGKRIKSRFARNLQKRQEITKTIAEKAAEALKDLGQAIKEIKAKGLKNFAEMSDEDYETIWKGFVVRVEPYEKKMQSAIEGFNATQREEVKGNLDKFVKSFTKPEVIEKIKKSELFNFKENLSAFVSISTPILRDLAQKEGKEAAGLLGLSDQDIITPEVAQALDDSINLLSDSYNSTTRDILKTKIEQALKEGKSQTELAKMINEIYSDFDDYRALAVARTETFRVANYATQQAWKQSGIVKSQKWYTAADERVCPWCEPQHGKVVSIDSLFFKKGDKVTGNDGTLLDIEYSDVGAPPLHVNCRCYLRPEEISLQ